MTKRGLNFVGYEFTEYMSNAEVDEIQVDVVGNDNYDYFHNFNSKGVIIGVNDNNIHIYIKRTEHIFVLKDTPYIYQKGVYIRDEDGSILMTLISGLIYPQFKKLPTIKRIYGLFLIDKWLKVNDSDLNNYPPQWINFKNGFYDPIADKIRQHDPKYKAINQIPHSYTPKSNTAATWRINQFLDFAMECDDKEMFLQYAGLCMTRDTRQQKFLMLKGKGGSGKSTLINLIIEMVGKENISAVDLESLTSNRFASFNLMHKLVNCCADIDNMPLTAIGNLKMITGGDQISGEPKGKKPIVFNSYAKLIFSANEVPRIKGEYSDAFYRRLLVLRMDKKPERVNYNLSNELNSEVSGFIEMSCAALRRLYESGGNLSESVRSQAEVGRLQLYFDNVEFFLNVKTDKDQDGKISAKEIYSEYERFCSEEGLTELLKQNFFRVLDSKGFSHADGRNIKGLQWKKTEFYQLDDDDEEPF